MPNQAVLVCRAQETDAESSEELGSPGSDMVGFELYVSLETAGYSLKVIPSKDN